MNLKSREAVISIDSSGSCVTLFTGAEGTRIKSVKDGESFRIDMGYIEKVANQILELAIQKKRNKDITLFLGI